MIKKKKGIWLEEAMRNKQCQSLSLFTLARTSTALPVLFDSL